MRILSAKFGQGQCGESRCGRRLCVTVSAITVIITLTSSTMIVVAIHVMLSAVAIDHVNFPVGPRCKHSYFRTIVEACPHSFPKQDTL